MTLHPVWLIAFATLGAFLVYIAVAGIHLGYDWRNVVPASLAGVVLLAAVALDATGVIS